MPWTRFRINRKIKTKNRRDDVENVLSVFMRNYELDSRLHSFLQLFPFVLIYISEYLWLYICHNFRVANNSTSCFSTFGSL